ncbi:MAG: hypothetical protein IPJ77_24835 [Planctomycetes bacterium]|nr:hypothetical protein [Planctomycetota bacterium]
MSTHAVRPSPVVVPPAEPGTAVLLIHAPYPARPRFDGLPSSLLSASARLVEHLTERGISFGLMDPGSSSEGFYESLELMLRSGSVRVVCISTSTAAIEETVRIARLVRSLCGSSPLVVVGGPHEDACRLKVAEAVPEVDVSIAGDGEFVLLELVRRFLELPDAASSAARALELFGHAQPSMRGRGTVTSRSWCQPFGRPFDFGPTEVESFHTRCQVARPVRFDVFPGGTAVPLTISRGCSYGQCTFCSEGGPGVKAQVCSDFEWIVDLSARHPGEPLYFQDSIFPATRRVRQELLPRLRGLGIEWGCQVYLPTLSERLVAELAENGCTYLYTGIESGSDDILRAIGKTGLTRALILERLGWFARHDMRAGLSLMFGAMADDGRLLETENTIAETLSLVHELQSRRVPIAGIYPNVETVLPGTALDHGSLDFYSMPRAPSFTDFEDGCVGYNFLTVVRPPDAARRRLAKTVSDATRSIVPTSEGAVARDASRRTCAVRP